MLDGDVRGPTFESHRGQLSLSWQPLRYTALGGLHTLTAVARSSGRLSEPRSPISVLTGLDVEQLRRHANVVPKKLQYRERFFTGNILMLHPPVWSIAVSCSSRVVMPIFKIEWSILLCILSYTVAETPRHCSITRVQQLKKNVNVKSHVFLWILKKT